MDEIEYLGTTSTIQSYNLFTYCEGNPVNMVDPDGNLAYPGEIHHEVVNHISSKYGYLKNICMFTSTGIGFCDLMSIDGHIWEVKSCTVNFNLAINQLSKYINGRVLPKIANKNGILVSKGNYRIGGYINAEKYTAKTRSGTYNITYWYAGEGIIYYSYSAKNKNSTQSSLSPAIGSSTAIVIGFCLSGMIGGNLLRNAGCDTGLDYAWR